MIEGMNFKESLRFLGIEDYGDTIFNSHSTGELFFIYEYTAFANALKQNDSDASWFRAFFLEVIKMANEEWDRPLSIYQHIFKIYDATIGEEAGNGE